jgi:hypothetical protein
MEQAEVFRGVEGFYQRSLSQNPEQILEQPHLQRTFKKI